MISVHWLNCKLLLFRKYINLGVAVIQCRNYLKVFSWLLRPLMMKSYYCTRTAQYILGVYHTFCHCIQAGCIPALCGKR